MSARILVVDDEPSMLRAVERVLSAEHEVVACTSPVEAAEKAKSFRPHVALVDIRMPEMDGFELLNALKQQDADIEVILMTGSIYDVDDQLIRAIREKAFYYITKPFDRQVLRTLVERCLEMRELEDANRRHVAHLEGQLEQARAFQRTMLSPTHARIEGFTIRAEYRPCVELAGDLYVYAAAGPGRVALLVADVVGHGAPAAMLTAVVRSAFHSAGEDGYEPLSVVHRTAEAIRAFPPDRFVTAVAARLSAERAEIVNAGHEGALVWGASRTPVEIGPTGPMISPVLGLGGWTSRELEWSEDSTLLLFTDGITETRRGDEEFGMERLVRTVSGSVPEHVLSAILDRVDLFGSGESPADDRTLLLARRAAG